MRRCLVIGGAGGMGSAICRSLAERGNELVVADFNADAAEKLAAELRAEGYNAHAESCDAASREQVEAMRDRIEAKLGPVDIVVPMVGVARNDIVVKIKDDEFDLVIATHVKSTLNAMRAFFPGMRQRGYGRMVTMSSVAARASFGGAAYAAAKSAIEGLTRTAALEMAKSGITVNAVAPGLVDAGMFRTVPKDYQESSVAAVPMKRAADPREIGACVAFLASDEASYVTGQTLLIDGGLSISSI